MATKRFAAVCVALAIAGTPAAAWAKSTYYKDCPDAYAEGVSHIKRGDPLYHDDLDSDHDGVGCESPPWGNERPAATRPTVTRPTTPTTKPASTPPKAVTAKPKFTG
jgi:hypothetical protein